MGRAQHIRKVEKLVRGIQRFGVKYIKPGTGDLAGTQGGQQCRPLNDARSACVDQYYAIWHAVELDVSNHPLRLLGEREMDR